MHDLITLRDHPEAISIRDALRAAFLQTITLDYVKLAWIPFVIVCIASIYAPQIVGILSFLAVIRITVGWLRYLNFGEPLEINIGKRDVRYLGWSMMVGAVTMVFMSLLTGLGMILGVWFLALGTLVAFTMAMILVPYGNIFMSLIALGYQDARELVIVTMAIVKPIQFHLWLIYVMLGAGMLLSSLFLKSGGSLLYILATVIDFMMLGVTLSFSSYILHHRCILTRPE